MIAMPPEAVQTPDPPPVGLPPPLADQVELIAAQFRPNAMPGGEELLRHVDAALLNICEIAEVGFDLLNRVMAMRAAAERLAQALDMPGRAAALAREEGWARALREFEALEVVLHDAGPSAAAKAKGLGWQVTTPARN